jgi:hypothetical protein
MGSQLDSRTLHWLAAAAASWAVGCTGAHISAGDEGDTINLSRCYGVECDLAPQSFQASATGQGEPCIDSGLALEEPFDFEGIGLPEATVRRLLPAPDGTFWALAVSYPDFTKIPPESILIHYSHEGELLGQSDPLEVGAGHRSDTSPAFGIDANGNVAVAVYGIYAPTADSPLVQRLRLFTFDADFAPVGDSLFSGIASAELAADPTGTLMLAGNATNNAKHGVLTRLVNGEPSWIQTKVPTSGQGVGAGVSGLVVNEAGESAIVSQRSGRWESGPDVATFGLARFDAKGQPLLDLMLPVQMQGGYGMSLGASSRGDFIVAGLQAMDSLLVRSVSSAGEVGWAFTAQSQWPNVTVDKSTDRVFALGVGALIAIDAEGRGCQSFEIENEEGELEVAMGDVLVQEPYVYLTRSNHVRRYRLPSE